MLTSLHICLRSLCVLIHCSFVSLGITGTFLGDYFGILMKEKVTGFPFNITNDPMYNGSSLLFLADAIAYILHTNQTNNQSTKREDFSMLWCEVIWFHCDDFEQKQKSSRCCFEFCCFCCISNRCQIFWRSLHSSNLFQEDLKKQVKKVQQRVETNQRNTNTNEKERNFFKFCSKTSTTIKEIMNQLSQNVSKTNWTQKKNKTSSFWFFFTPNKIQQIRWTIQEKNDLLCDSLPI